MLCWRNILPSSQHFLTTSNIPKFSSTNFWILNYFQIPLFLAGGTTCDGLLSCCLVISTKINAQGFLPSIIFTRAYPMVDSRDYRKLVNLGIELVYPSCRPKSQRIRVSQLIPNLAT